jgi:hypothetical protein
MKDDVLEIWDQPPSIPLEYYDRHGRLQRVMYTPDYFLFRSFHYDSRRFRNESEIDATPRATSSTYAGPTRPPCHSLVLQQPLPACSLQTALPARAHRRREGRGGP